MSSPGRWKSSTRPISPARPADPEHRGPRRPSGWFLALAAALSAIVTAPAAAHDIPDERVDRALQIDLEPGSLRVVYELSLTEWTLYQDLKRLAPELARGESADWIGRYVRTVAPLNARGLLATVDDEELEWVLGEPEVDFEEHPILRFSIRAAIPDRGLLRIRDTNYASSYGSSRLAFRASPEVRAVGYEGPADLAEVPELPVWALSDEEERGTREVEVSYESEAAPRVASADEGREVPAGPVDPVEAPAVPGLEGGSRDRLTRLFWEASGTTIPLLLIGAFLMGAAHAVQPGHGKSVVVGASLQGPRPVGRGLVLAGTAAAMHLFLAVVLAIVAVMLVPSSFDRIDGPLTRGVGLLLAILGAWRVGASVHGRTAAEGEASGRPIRSPRDAVLTGLAVGAIPCWDAVLLLAIAWAVGQVMLGVGLVLVFSLGASATMLGVALAAGLFRSLATRWSASSVPERSLGAAGGLIMAGIGGVLFFA